MEPVSRADVVTCEGFGFMQNFAASIGRLGQTTIKGLPNVGNVVRDGKNSGRAIRCKLASSYGNLTKDSFQRMDKEMKIIIGYTIGRLGKVSNLNWDTVIACMNTNVLLKPKPGSVIHRRDGISKSGTGVFKTDGSPSSSVVREINSWFNRLVSDADVLNDTGVDIHALGRLVASTGASVSDFGAFFHKSVSKSMDVMDVSVLRYPDLDRPFFKVYRIRLRAWRKCERFLFIQKDRSGINGEYDCVSYDPKPEVIARLHKNVIDTAIQSVMMQNSLIRPEGNAIHKSDKLIKKGRSAFKFDGSPDNSIVKEVNAWFTKLISDADVLKDTKIDINLMARIVAASGAKIDSFASFFFKKEFYERTVVDVGILRYPDLDHPFFKLYRIELTAWSDCTRILFVQDDKNGITGVYNCRKFVPRESVMKRLRAKTIGKAVDEAEDLFAD